MQLTMFFLMLAISVLAVSAAEKDYYRNAEDRSDLHASATSAKLFNLAGLFGQNQNYPYGYGSYYPNTYYNRPPYSTYPGVYRPSLNYPSTGWTGSNYYPYQGYSGNSGSYYPSYPSTGGYYPTGGTNILGGNGGYGGYGGNGGLRQYFGYRDPEYTGHRNRCFGYYINSDSNGCSKYANIYERGRDRVVGGYRGYD